MKLYKSLSSAIQNHEDIQLLKINIKESHFPSEIFDFPNLRELYLEGQCAEFSIPDGHLINLKVLSIKWPSFKGSLSSVFRLPHLENLKIIDTPLASFLLPLGNAPAPLKSLTIKNCSLKKLPEEISMLWQIQEMNLSGNELDNLPYSFMDLKNLRRLNLDHNEFRKFPDEIKRNPSLQHLSIDHNKFSEEEKERIQRLFHIWTE